MTPNMADMWRLAKERAEHDGAAPKLMLQISVDRSISKREAAGLGRARCHDHQLEENVERLGFFEGGAVRLSYIKLRKDRVSSWINRPLLFHHLET